MQLSVKAFSSMVSTLLGMIKCIISLELNALLSIILMLPGKVISEIPQSLKTPLPILVIVCPSSSSGIVIKLPKLEISLKKEQLVNTPFCITTSSFC
jgi:hypothetical protein